MNGCPWETVRAIIDDALAASAGDRTAVERLQGMALALPASRIAHRPSYPPLVYVPPVVTVTREPREAWPAPELQVAA